MRILCVFRARIKPHVTSLLKRYSNALENKMGFKLWEPPEKPETLRFNGVNIWALCTFIFLFSSPLATKLHSTHFIWRNLSAVMGLFDKLPFIALSVGEWLVRFSPTCSPVTVSAWVRTLWNPSAQPRNRVETPQMRAPTMERGKTPAIGWRCRLQSIKGEALMCLLVCLEKRESQRSELMMGTEKPCVKLINTNNNTIWLFCFVVFAIESILVLVTKLLLALSYIIIKVHLYFIKYSLGIKQTTIISPILNKS